MNDILRSAGLTSVVISSTQRTPADQARAMIENLENVGPKALKDLYSTWRSRSRSSNRDPDWFRTARDDAGHVERMKTTNGSRSTIDLSLPSRG